MSTHETGGASIDALRTVGLQVTEQLWTDPRPDSYWLAERLVVDLARVEWLPFFGLDGEGDERVVRLADGRETPFDVAVDRVACAVDFALRQLDRRRVREAEDAERGSDG